MSGDNDIVRPHDVYQLPVQDSYDDLNDIWAEQMFNGCYYNHMPEAPEAYASAAFYPNANEVEVLVHKHFNFDSRRFWRLASAWFAGNPFMIVQNAGREGDDFNRRFITDPIRYWEAVNYINANLNTSVPGGSLEDVVDPLAAIGADLTTFYGNSLHGYFERY